MQDSNIFQNTLSKNYISEQESYWYVNLESRYDLKCPKINIVNFKFLHASMAFFAIFLGLHIGKNRKKPKWTSWLHRKPIGDRTVWPLQNVNDKNQQNKL